MKNIFLGLGSNLEDREANLRRALVLLMINRVQVVEVSPIFETDPVGYKRQHRFLNAVCRVETELGPFGLLQLVKAVEEEIGRIPSFRNAPRVIDIDILFYDNRVVASPELKVPHPRIAQRAFVLCPLNSIAPELVHPGLNRSVQELCREVGITGIQAWGPPPDLSALRPWCPVV